MALVPYAPESVQTLSVVAETEADQQLAARVVAVRFGLPPNIAELVCRLAGIGQREAT